MFCNAHICKVRSQKCCYLGGVGYLVWLDGYPAIESIILNNKNSLQDADKISIS